MHSGTGCTGLRAGGGKKAVVCSMNACSKDLVVGSRRLPESASDTCCTLRASWLFFASYFPFSYLFCSALSQLFTQHLRAWNKDPKVLMSTFSQLGALLCHPVLRSFPPGCILSYSGKIRKWRPFTSNACDPMTASMFVRAYLTSCHIFHLQTSGLQKGQAV